MVSELDSGARGPGSGPGWGVEILLVGDRLRRVGSLARKQT